MKDSKMDLLIADCLLWGLAAVIILTGLCSSMERLTDYV